VTRQPVQRFKPRRWHAAFYARYAGHEPPRMQELRRSVIGGGRDRVLELGAGTGAAFAYYRDVERVIATEPDPFMLMRARRAAAAASAPIVLLRAAGESLPLADASVDTVMSVLVLCTVQDPEQVLAEVRRVLRPDGTLRFMEHVRGNGALGLFHDVVAPAWRYFVGGCNPNRRTEETIAASGFEITAIEHRPLSTGLPAILGTAQPRSGAAATGAKSEP
jgi:SAM-dependent methyltransferase